LNERERVASLIFGVAGVLCAFVAGIQRDASLPALGTSIPLVGRPAHELVTGPPRRFEHIRVRSSAELAAENRAQVHQEFARDLAPPDLSAFDRIVVSVLEARPLVGNLEEGPPHHLVIEPDGTVRSTPRFRNGRPGAPPGVLASEVDRAIHLVIPEVRQGGRVRKEMLVHLLAWLRLRLGGKVRVLLASETPGATATLPEGISPEDVLPQKRDAR